MLTLLSYLSEPEHYQTHKNYQYLHQINNENVNCTTAGKWHLGSHTAAVTPTHRLETLNQSKQTKN